MIRQMYKTNLEKLIQVNDVIFDIVSLFIKNRVEDFVEITRE